MIGLKKEKPEETEIVMEEVSKEVKVSTKATAELDDLKEQIQEGIDAEQAVIPPIGHKEIKSLNRNKYETISKNFDTIFLIQNKRTQQIVELRAASSVHACNLIGWKPKHVRVLEEKSTNKEVKPSSVGEIVKVQVDKFNDAISTASSSKTPPNDMLSG